MSGFVAKVVCSAAVVGVYIVAASAAIGDVNLEWRTSSPKVRMGDTVEVGLYAVSDDGTDQPFAAMDAIISWNPTVLRLVGTRDDGPYEWMISWFPYDSGLARLNADCGATRFCSPYTGRPYNDGDAFYEVIAPFGLDPPPYATVQGLLVTTFIFVAEAGTPATEIGFLKDAGQSRTVVLGAEWYADVTGELGTLTLTIRGCGSMGDFDGDCAVSLSDYAVFPACQSGPGAGSPLSACRVFDIDADADADLRDFAELQRLFESVE